MAHVVRLPLNKQATLPTRFFDELALQSVMISPRFRIRYQRWRQQTDNVCLSPPHFFANNKHARQIEIQATENESKAHIFLCMLPGMQLELSA